MDAGDARGYAAFLSRLMPVSSRFMPTTRSAAHEKGAHAGPLGASGCRSAGRALAQNLEGRQGLALQHFQEGAAAG
ncbi:hypothetical protein, partial [Escherichia coli]|uniref:hypothetical protein n=1 Tax=Escherichia coli TaxID=562 RepID=UPI001BC8A996